MGGGWGVGGGGDLQSAATGRRASITQTQTEASLASTLGNSWKGLNCARWRPIFFFLFLKRVPCQGPPGTRIARFPQTGIDHVLE